MVKENLVKHQKISKYYEHDYSPRSNSEAVAVARKCSVKGMFLKIWQDSQEHTCIGISFSIKLQA